MSTRQRISQALQLGPNPRRLQPRWGKQNNVPTDVVACAGDLTSVRHSLSVLFLGPHVLRTVLTPVGVRRIAVDDAKNEIAAQERAGVN